MSNRESDGAQDDSGTPRNYAHNRENRLSYSVHIWELEPDETPDRGNRKTMRSLCQAGCTYQALKPGLPDLDAEKVCGNCARIVRAREDSDE